MQDAESPWTWFVDVFACTVQWYARSHALEVVNTTLKTFLCTKRKEEHEVA